jgi:hypothetical protein
MGYVSEEIMFPIRFSKYNHLPVIVTLFISVIKWESTFKK